MPRSIAELGADFDDARRARTRRTATGRDVPTPFPSPEDWRDVWIYFLLVDRFHNPAGPPHHQPWDGAHGTFQGGTLEGVRARLEYLKGLGAGAIWLSPIVKNPRFDEGSYHGYGAQDFLSIEPRLSSDPDRARRDPVFVEEELRRLVDDAHGLGMYVILDVVLNHAGDVFEYEGHGAVAPWSDRPYRIRWRDEDGRGRPDWTDEPPTDPPPDAALWPAELRRKEYVRRQGNAFTEGHHSEDGGDFHSLKELVTEHQVDGSFPVRSALIRAWQHFIARFDVDGFRIDTLKYVEPEFARVFGNAVREFALSIGKKNFFTFGEVYDDEEKIAGFVGRRVTESGDLVGVDAALDFPLFYKLPWVAKGAIPPSEVVETFERRKRVQRDVVSSHGDASRFFVTFLDNHDLHGRFRFSDPADPGRYDDQLTLALALLFSLQGIPCVYYGTEQGLHGAGDRPEAVREALWGKPEAFDPSHPFARACRDLTSVRSSQPALRYGRQYFRPISGDGVTFGVSPFPQGVLAFSRILNDLETLVVANTGTASGWTGEVVVDRHLHPAGAALGVVYTNRPGPEPPVAEPLVEKGPGSVLVREVGGAVSAGPIRAVRASLGPMEVRILGAVPASG